MIDVKFRRLASSLQCLLTLLLCVISAATFALQPTQQQISQFKSMSPAQQSQLAQQFGVNIPQAAQASPVETATQKNSVTTRKVDAESVVSLEVANGEKTVAGKRLKPFGYDLFAGKPTSFTPVTDIPVSSDYILGPGDSLKVNLFGKESQFYELAIDQEGTVYIPELGPLSLVGLSFSEAKQRLVDTIDQKMIGVKASVSMGQLRSIRIFVLGEAYLPGSYVVSSLSTMTNALVLSGGISANGSLRNIQLKRKGELIQSLDLYDLLLKGDTSDDAQLRSGDVVFIPPVGTTAGIKGQVRRPAIYELKGEEMTDELISLAGGLRPSAQPKLAKLERIGNNDKKDLIDIDLDQQGSQILVRNGDVLVIPASLEILDNIVTVSGHVFRSGLQNWYEGVRLSDVILDAGIKPYTDLQYALIKRYLPPSGELQVIAFALSEVLEKPGSESDLTLLNQDELILFGLYESKRTARVAGIVDELRVHAGLDKPSKEVVVSGNVRYPGTYPLINGMQVKDLIHAAGGLTEKAFQLSAEISRIEFNEQQERSQYRVGLDLAQADSLTFALKSRDVLQIKTIPNWAESKRVTLTGEVKFPGVYPIYKDDTLAVLLERAGGLTEYAYVPGAIFTREQLKKQQAQQLQEMQQRLAEDIAKAELIATNQSGEEKEKGDVGEAQKLLAQLKQTPAMGRLVIDLQKVLDKKADYSIPLQDGDTLFIPTKKNSVTIIGEVQLPISQVYEQELGYWEYINRSGGTTDKADEDRVYIIKANGGVQIPQSSNWFASADTQIAPGDTIVVPLDADKLDQIVLWRDMTQIFYQIALGAAAVGSL